MSLVNNSESELDSRDARLDFENVLQDILEKANALERLPSDQEHEKNGTSDEASKEQKSSHSSPQKPSTPRTGKKRRKRDEPRGDEDQKASPYVMKLFDRSVDLAPFNDETPLYPICRAWMENDPHKKNAHSHLNGTSQEEGHAENDSSEDEDASLVKKMPLPNTPWNNIDENGKYRSPRIPSLLAQPGINSSENFVNKYAIEETESHAAKTLLLHHVQHWKKVRQTWKAKSIENEERYKDGMNLLLDMFYRSSQFNSQ